MRPREYGAALGLAIVLVALGALGCQTAAPGGVGTAGSGNAPAAAGAPPAPAAGPAVAPTMAPTPMPVRIVHSTRNGSQAIAQVLIDAGLLAENGLAGSLLHVDGPARAIAVLLTGEADVALMGGEAALNAAIEGAEITIVGGFLNRRDHVIYAVPEVQSVTDLRGKRIGINGLGAADQRAIIEALQHFRIDPQDVNFIVLAGGPANRLAAIQSGGVDATGLQPPLTGRARQAGLRELVQVGQVVERSVPVNAVVAGRGAVAERPDLYRRFTRALVQAVYLYHAQPDAVLRAFANFFALDLAENHADLEETRAHYGPLHPTLPIAPVDGYQQVLEEWTETNPRAATFRLADLINNRFVEEVEASGLHRQLYGR